MCDYFREAAGLIRVSVLFEWISMDLCWETHKNWTLLWTNMWFTTSPVVLNVQKLFIHWMTWHINLSYVSIEHSQPFVCSFCCFSFFFLIRC